MIQIHRSVVRRFRTMLRKTAPPGSPTRLQVVVLHASGDGLRLRSPSLHIAIEYELLGKFAPEVFAVSMELFDRIEGRDESPVSLELVADKVTARWTDAGVPQSAEFDLIDPQSLRDLPATPKKWATNSAALLRALGDASAATDESAVKYAINRIQLRGKSGSVVGTDGRQLFVESGFSFPFSENLLIPRVLFFGGREFPGEAAVEIGVTEHYVALRVSPWTFHLRIDKEGRFPQVDSIIPDLNAALATLRMSAEDAEFLAQTLPRLPGHEDPAAPVTIDCNGRVAVRGISEGQKVPTELVLARSECTGQAVSAASDRKFLMQALNLGMREFRLFGPGQLTYCHDGPRQYMWMGLSEEAIVKATDEMTCVKADQAKIGAPAKPKGAKKPVSTSPAPSGKTASRTASKKGHGIAAVIEDAQTLKTALRDALHRSSQLVASLKRHRKQAKIMRSTIAALRQLAPIEQ